MKAFCSFASAAIYAGGSVGPYATVSGRVLFGTVVAAGWGYLMGWAIGYLCQWSRRPSGS